MLGRMGPGPRSEAMRIVRLLFAAALAVGVASAQAAAFAEVELSRIVGGINDQVLFDFDPAYTNTSFASGATEDLVHVFRTEDSHVFTSRPLVAGETFYVDVSYTITLRDDGGQSARNGWALPLEGGSGFFSSVQGAYAALIPGLYDFASNYQGVVRTLEFVEFDTGYDLAPSDLTFSGVARGTYTVTDSLTPFPQGELRVFVATFAQSALIPEPGTWALMLGGLALLAQLRRASKRSK
jgi:hypothetical protein